MFRWLKKNATPSNGPPTDSDDFEPHSAEGDQPEQQGWIGVDLDGTLAEYTGWLGIEHVGKPIPLMKRRVLEWIAAGYTIKIMTARASEEGGTLPVQKWLAKNGLPPLEVTNEKDFQMIELWDDRAIQVVANTGRPVLRPTQSATPRAPLFGNESPDTFERAKQKSSRQTKP